MKAALRLLPGAALDAAIDAVVALGVALALGTRGLGRWWGRSFGVRATAASAGGAVLATASTVTIDRPIAEQFRALDPGWKAVAELVTQLGDSAGYIVGGVVLAVLLWWAERAGPRLGARWRFGLWARRSAFFAAAVALSGVLSILLKNLFGRPRPRMWFDEQLAAFQPFTIDTSSDFASFPSGHATTIWTVAFALILISRRSAWVMLPLALAVSATRVVLNDHFVGDIIAGAILGGLTALALKPVFRIDAGTR